MIITSTTRRRLLLPGTVSAVVPVSGGKDSQACLKIAVEEFGARNVLGLHCDTGWEHPYTVDHISKLSDLYGVRICTVSAGTVPEKVRKYGMFPVGGARFCTDELKLVPAKLFYRQTALALGHGFQVFSGVRSQESGARRKRYAKHASGEVYAPHEVMPGKFPKYLDALGVRMRLPILDWSAVQVMDFVGRANLNPLYAEGFDRVGCFPCLAAGDRVKEKCFRHDDTGRARKVIVLQLEKDTGKSVWQRDSARKRNDPGAPCGFCLFS